MSALIHPEQALFAGEKPFPILAACEHYAGSDKLIGRALALQHEHGPVFDITCDCEDGAAAGQERAHAEMVVRHLLSPQNRYQRMGVRIHDPSHPAWRQDLEIVLGSAAQAVAYITIPKATNWQQVQEVVETIARQAQAAGRHHPVPVHVLVETHGALRDAMQIAALPQVEVLDFGLMDFVSDHHGAIPASAMRSPGQFEHALLVRAKAEVVAAALANGVVPAHNVCLNLKDPDVVLADATRARQSFGFLRMWSIHPVQIMPIVQAMRPDFAEVQDAGAILLAAQDAHWGPIQYAGELHDRATYRYYWEVLQKAKVTGMALDAAVQQRFFSQAA